MAKDSIRSLGLDALDDKPVWAGDSIGWPIAGDMAFALPKETSIWLVAKKYVALGQCPPYCVVERLGAELTPMAATWMVRVGAAAQRTLRETRRRAEHQSEILRWVRGVIDTRLPSRAGVVRTRAERKAEREAQLALPFESATTITEGTES